MKIARHYVRWLATMLLVALVFFVTDRLARTGSLFGNRSIIINNIKAPPVPTLEPARVAFGATLYAQNCASCHGANLEGQADWQQPDADGALLPPPHDSNGHTWHHKDDLLIEITLNGGDPQAKSKMPAFKDKLSEAEVVAILDFIKSQWGQKEREFQWWMTTVSDQQ